MVALGYGFGVLCIIGCAIAAPGWALMMGAGYLGLLWIIERLFQPPR